MQIHLELCTGFLPFSEQISVEQLHEKLLRNL